jgi:hypothetical protein
MSSVTLTSPARGILQHSRWDSLLIVLAAGHGALLCAVPSAPLIALGLWWNSNTVAHYFIHRPFFRARALNVLFSVYLSVLLGVPQELWRGRHLTHHFGCCWQGWRPGLLVVEVILVAGLWTWLAASMPWFFITAYLPSYLAGLGLCWLHGYYEHARGTTSHYGRLYNWLFFNDGYHCEHHQHPDEHWTCLPRLPDADPCASRWPAVLRWLELFSLDALERGVLRSSALQRWVLRWHERAFHQLLPYLPAVSRVGIIGGGLFPRTLMILQRLLPEARFVVIDQSADSIRTARERVAGNVQFVHSRYDSTRVRDLDLLVFPLSFRGEREALYAQPAAPFLVIHDWLWRRRGTSAVVSLLLLKRLNLIMREPRIEEYHAQRELAGCTGAGQGTGSRRT